MHALSDSSCSLSVEQETRSDGSLDPSRLLDEPKGKWIVNLYPEAGEGTVVRNSGGPGPNRKAPAEEDPDRRAKLDYQHGCAAKARVRRFARANRLKFLWTLTFAEPCRSLAEAGAAWDAFTRRLRDTMKPFPWVAVFEPHPGGHGFHVHFATDRFLSIELIRKLWQRGIVHVSESKKGRKGIPVRKVAAYLAKYIGKTLEEGAYPRAADDGQADDDRAGQLVGQRRRGEHRYRVAQGFDPKKITRYFRTPERAYHWLLWYYGDYADAKQLSFTGEGNIDGWWFDFPDRCIDRWRKSQTDEAA